MYKKLLIIPMILICSASWALQTIDRDRPADYGLVCLKKELKAKFADRFVDVNEVIPNTLRIYLVSIQPNDDVNYSDVLSTHDVQSCRDAEQTDYTQRDARIKKLLDALISIMPNPKPTRKQLFNAFRDMNNERFAQ